jgi:hypothetical protein
LGALGLSRQAVSAGAVAAIGVIAGAAVVLAGLATFGAVFAQESGIEKALEATWGTLAGVDDVRDLFPECPRRSGTAALIWTLVSGLVWFVAFMLMAVVWATLIVGPVVTVIGGARAAIKHRNDWLNRGLLLLVCGFGALIVSGLLMRLSNALWMGLVC